MEASGRRRFFTAPAPSPAEVEPLLVRIVRRAHALLDGRDGSPHDERELALARTRVDRLVQGTPCPLHDNEREPSLRVNLASPPSRRRP